MATKLVRNEWMADGATVYAITGHHGNGSLGITKLTVQRATPTQLILTDDQSREVRYRQGAHKLVEVGRDYYSSPELVPPTDPRLKAEVARRKAKKAIAPVADAIQDLSRGARIYHTEPAEALANMTRLAETVNAAVAELQRIVAGRPES